jgi:hypothetical protein
MIEAVADLRLPPRADRRLQDLMDRYTEGALLPTEREELAALVEMSESLSLVRAGHARSRANTAMTTRPEVARLVALRAGDRCEYCRMHQSLQGATFHVAVCPSP